MTIKELIKEELAIVTARLDKGKGTYGNPDYVKDDTWSTWLGERYALNTLLWRANEAGL